MLKAVPMGDGGSRFEVNVNVRTTQLPASRPLSRPSSWVDGTNATARRNPRQSSRQSGRAGFTLVEILIVVVILGILASIVVPQFSNASQTARQNTLREELQYLRTQINVYQAQHLDISAGYPAGNSAGTPTAANFTNQMTLFTDQFGNTSATGSATFAFGPYLSQMPTNPVNNMTTVLVVANNTAIPAADGSTAWIYKPQTLEIYANNTGNDTNGVPFSSY
jgi:general secretion pathway protein G